MAKKILIIAAHPDDEILGCAGTVARLIRENFTAYTLLLSEGITSRHITTSDKIIKKLVSQLKKEAIRANNTIGVKKIFFCCFPDNKFDSVPLLDIVKEIDKIKKIIKPDIIFTHFEKDLNVDHQLTFKAVLTATRPLPKETVREIYSFEIPSSTEWGYPLTFFPDVFFDVSRTLNFKIKALSLYNSELRVFPHPRSLKCAQLNSKLWGVKVGVEYAEAFKLVRAIK